MMTKTIEKAIIRYITGTASADELTMLSKWVEKPSNQKQLQTFIEDYYAIQYNIYEPNTDRAVHRLLSSIKKRKTLDYKKKRHYFIKYAAAIVTIISLIGGYTFKENLFTNELSQSATEEIKAGTDKAILTLGDGSEIQLGEQEVYTSEKFGSNGSTLEYFDNDKHSSNTTNYHYLTVPRGGKFMIKLSDGTKVWLNSDSRLKYPEKFKKGESRKVELVYGEAYFDVSSSSKNNGADFRVYNKGKEIQVLGTQFNIKAYNEEQQIFTTLVEGKISFKYEDHEKILSPGQQAIYNLKNKVILTKTIDIYNEISWKDGIFSFDNKPLGDIMKVLSRWYDVKFIFSNEQTKNEQFIGILSKDQEIESILLQLKNSGIIKNYKIKNSEIEIE
ncbi:MAG: FecR family protein [Zunongwangia sp.]|uniref:FecR family protein n=1 Tax=Zunongwangia sp. TaxID=1965325 RepID=UPI003241D7A6